ncbi:ATP-dependent DNA helicase [Cytobacillus spongiae]|uniref:ATP-dependent DNA helicase n=1 Tax=Cytobacillus spongiae TaxID=2901381 RepID=UPI001F230205|nr:ATP-dependent DNA helicase [Cytobacillus spongiae]UII54608.1 ATP-dependent DNA helicase [Cytobacillus spongiae]
MNVLLAMMLFFTNWYYIPSESPSLPVEVESIDLKLKNDEIAFTFLSISDGEAILIQHGNGENILINTGGEGTEKEIKKLLQLYDVNKISTILLTEDDRCCNSNLEWMITFYDVKQLITGDSLLNKLKEQIDLYDDVSVHSWSKGTKQQILPGFHSEVLFEGSGVEEGMDLAIHFFRHKILLMSSTNKSVEQQFLKKDLADINIVKIPSFARENAVSESLIKHIDPQMAIIFQSKTTKPSSELLDMLHQAWIDVYYTKKHGTVTMKFTDINYEVITISNKDEL